MSASRTFRIFVSSTFSDLKAERNALQERVFPDLRQLCAAQGWQFQAVDLRWGVSEEAGHDQRTMRKKWNCFEKRPERLTALGLTISGRDGSSGRDKEGQSWAE